MELALPVLKGARQISRTKVCLHVLASSAQNQINVNYPEVWVCRFQAGSGPKTNTSSDPSKLLYKTEA